MAYDINLGHGKTDGSVLANPTSTEQVTSDYSCTAGGSCDTRSLFLLRVRTLWQDGNDGRVR